MRCAVRAVAAYSRKWKGRRGDCAAVADDDGATIAESEWQPARTPNEAVIQRVTTRLRAR